MFKSNFAAATVLAAGLFALALAPALAAPALTSVGAAGSSDDGIAPSIDPEERSDAPPSTAPPTDNGIVPPVESRGPAPQPENTAALEGLAPANDGFAAAKTMSGEQWVSSVTTVDATLEQGEPRSFSHVPTTSIGNTTWLKWKAPRSGSVTIRVDPLLSTSRTTLAVYTGSKVSKLQRLAVNRGIETVDDPGSRIVGLPVRKNVTYRIQIGAYYVLGDLAGALDAAVVELEGEYAAPANDDKGSAAAKSGTSWSSTVNLGGSSLESWESDENPEYPLFPITNSVWWKWTPKSLGTIALDTTAGHPYLDQGVPSVSFDTYLAVWEERPLTGFIRLAFKDQGASNNRSAISGLTVRPNTTYYIQAGVVGGELPGKLTVSFTQTETGPYITKLSKTSGPKTGGTLLTITGKRLSAVTQVHFAVGPTVSAASFLSHSDTSITLVTPNWGATPSTAYVVASTGGQSSGVHSKTYFSFK